MIQTSDGREEAFALEPMSVATFYARLTKRLEKLDIRLRIHPLPNEVENPIRFDHDQVHCAYDAEYANRFWRALVQADRVFKIFRSSFIGKASPVHLFWGAPDLAVTRFSGRRAPLHPGGIPHLPDWVTREAYSHEVSSCGFWPGGGAIDYPAFYSYAYPEPTGFTQAPNTGRTPRSTATICTNSFCRTTPCGKPHRRIRCFSTFCRRRTKQPRIWATGIARHLSATTPQFRNLLGEELERCRNLPAQQCIACRPFGFGLELLEEARFTGNQQRDRHSVAVQHAVSGQRGQPRTRTQNANEVQRICAAQAHQRPRWLAPPHVAQQTDRFRDRELLA